MFRSGLIAVKPTMHFSCEFKLSTFSFVIDPGFPFSHSSVPATCYVWDDITIVMDKFSSSAHSQVDDLNNALNYIIFILMTL